MFVNVRTMNIITMAYLGDAVYELYIREYLINKGIIYADQLQKEEVRYVSAKGQVRILNYLLDHDVLNEEEVDIVKRGRNYKRNYHPRNTDIMTYKMSTGFEALIGYLYLNNKSRLEEILKYIEVE